jgi:hypothetical protein
MLMFLSGMPMLLSAGLLGDQLPFVTAQRARPSRAVTWSAVRSEEEFVTKTGFMFFIWEEADGDGIADSSNVARAGGAEFSQKCFDLMLRACLAP